MSLTIYHNPRCSKSRQTLEIIQGRDVVPTVIRYLETPPAAATIMALADSIGMPVADLLRSGDEVVRSASDLPPASDSAATAEWIARHPSALQRPIVVDESSGRAVIGRPPENVLQLLD